MELFNADNARSIVNGVENDEKCVEQIVWKAINDAAWRGEYSVIVSVPIKLDKYIVSRLTSMGFEARIDAGIYYSHIHINWIQ